MATTKKIKLSDDAVAEDSPGVFQALEQVQQKLDQVRVVTSGAPLPLNAFRDCDHAAFYAQITDQRSDEILAVERRYNEIRRPVYLERNTLMREVPDLWLQCMLQHQAIADMVTERDTELLSYLEEVSLYKQARTCSGGNIGLTQDASQVDVEDFPDIKSGYKITFTFRENPFFKNQQLVKELHYADDNALAVKGTDIEWTEEGVCL